MKELITFLLILALFEAMPGYGRPDPPPPAAAACIVAVIGVACAGCLIYGLYRMCEHIPAPETEPPPWAPISEIPGMGPPSYLRPLPPLWMHNQLMASRVSLQHQDAGDSNWQTDYSFAVTDSQIGGMAMVAYDSNGVPIVTNDVAVITYQGEPCAPLMFTNLPPSMSSNSARMFRLISQ